MSESNSITFTLDGQEVAAKPGETIWQVAQRQGVEIPHLCYSPEPGYRSDGNCRACMVEIEGERVLAPSCTRKPSEGMVVKSASERAKQSRDMVFELLMADQPAKPVAHDDRSKFWAWADRMGIEESRYPAKTDLGLSQPAPDSSHAAIAVNLDACINCGLCVRACREVQVNDVIGMAFRGSGAKIVFDFDDAMGQSTCVGCGECVQACPTGALMEARLLDDQGVRVAYEDKTVQSGCPYCGVGCQVDYKVQGEQILYADGHDGPANENRLCVKGRFGFDYTKHPSRLTKPLIRKAYAPKASSMEIDPTNPFTHFREASWEEALELAGQGLRRIKDQHGPKALAGFGSAKGSNEEAYLFQKLVRMGFGSNYVDHCTRLCHASSVAALIEGIGTGAVTAPFTAAQDADCIIVIGSNPTVNHPVAATYIKQAAKRGAKLVVMDPRKQGLTRHAWKHLQFKSGQDVPMLNAMIHTILAEDLIDHDYVARMTDGIEDIRAAVKDFSPEAMAPLCGIDAETLREVARSYAKSKASIIFWGMGVSQHVHGTDNARCLIHLALLTGQTGRPGSGLHPLRGQNNVQGASDAGLIPMFYPDYQSVMNADIQNRFEDFWGADLDPVKGLTVVEIIDKAFEGEVKGMYVMGENPAMSDPDQRHARAGLANLDMLVVQDIFMTETAYFADVILPSSAYHEKWGSFTNTNRQVQIARPVVPMPGEAKQDLEIIQLIARQLGLNWHYSGAGEVFGEMAEVMKSLNNISWERLERESAVTYPCAAPDQPGQDIIFADAFPTASGKGKLVPTGIVPPDELPDADYPMILSTGRILEHWHTGSMTRRAGVLDSIEPEAVAFMHPRYLREQGIEAGDMVQVATRRGHVEIRARADRDVPQSMVFIPFCFAEASANLLTNPVLDPFGKIPEFKFCAARVAKLDGDQAIAAE
jgi:formate dehydrogenase major subunit